MCNGCPATAGIDAGNGETICRFHYGAPASEWQSITNRLRQREWMVKAADYCAQGDVNPAWFDRAVIAAEAAGRPDLAPTHKRTTRAGKVRDDAEHPMLYAQALNGVLGTECAAERKAPPMPEKLRKILGSVKLGDMLGNFETEDEREARLEREAIQAESSA
jgi:hypothetical protein